jgi:MFS family permease
MSASPTLSRPAPRLGRRFGFLAVTYAFAVTMLGTTLPTPLYALYRAKFGFSELTITLVFAAYAAGVIAALILFGRVSDAIGRRRTLLPGLAFSALSAVAFLLAHGLAMLFVGRVLSGLSAGIFTGTATATMLDLAPADARGRATLVATMANIGGLGLGPLFAGAFAQWAAHKLTLAFWADLIVLVPAVVAVALMPEPGQPTGARRLRPQTLSVPPDLRMQFVAAALGGFAGFAMLGLFTAVSPAFLAGLLHEPSHILLGVIVFSVFAASLAGQMSLDRVGADRAVPLGCVVLAVAMLLLAASLLASSLVLLVVAGMIGAAGQGLAFRAGLAGLGAAAPPERRAEIASSFFIVAYVAISLPVIGVGLLADAASLRTAGLVFAVVVAALAAVAALLFRTRVRGAG